MLDQSPAAPADAVPAPAEQPTPVRHRPGFTGTTAEYFGIWLVNLVLSILTLGIYSAWAKVRTERYFYANTRLAGSTFEYLADPIAILKGRLIAYAVVVALVLSSEFSPLLYGVLILGVFALLPAVIVWSLRFRARNSAWRGLRFRFGGQVGAAYGPFLGWPILSALTGTLLYPLMKRRQHEFVVDEHRFGRKRFDFAGDVGQYYVPYLIALGIGVVLFFVMMGGMVGAILTGGGDDEPGAAMVAVLALFYLGFFALTVFLRVRYANLLWNSTRLGGHRFESALRARDMLWIYASNLVAIVCTLGLAIPWAMIRLARYRAEHFTFVTRGSLEDFVAELEGEHGAAGAELVDALDLGTDFGL